MCGIAGIIRLDEGQVSREDLKVMADTIQHRGPDGEGLWVSNTGEAGFSHRRLSIIDLTNTGSQPMHYADKRYTIVFNGEIYNYVELKEWLMRFKYEFVSTSDTEVLLALYDLKKEKCLDYLDGMFSFAIWDEKEKELFCSRDRFGEKPFFYYLNNNSFYFASEIKSIKKVKPEIKIDLYRLQHYIRDNASCLPSESFFTDINQLPAAHYLRIKDSKVEVKRYWEIDLHKRTRYIRTSQYYEHFFELFRRSVSRRLRSDVNVGSSLSGGLDSSVVVCSIGNLQYSHFNTFSARFPGSPSDEGKWIEKVVEHSGIKNFQVVPDFRDFISQVKSLLYIHEFPVASSSVYAQWCVMKLAKDKNTKVLLDGQGADEYLAGYDNLKYFALWELYRKGKIMQFRKEVHYLKTNFGQQRSVGLKFIYDPVLQLLGKRRKVYNKGYTLRERLKSAVEFELPELLRYADRNSMGNSVEVRLPFLNHQLVEYAFSLPPEQIYQKGRTKYVLREATKSILPEAIYSRTDKIGFAPPEQAWLNDPLFKQAIAEATAVVDAAGLQTGNNDFRNFIAGNFISAFS